MITGYNYYQHVHNFWLDGGGTTPAASESVPHKDTPPVAVNISKESSTISGKLGDHSELLLSH